MDELNTMKIRMERINALAETLYDLLCDNHRAQVLVEIIIETSNQKKTDNTDFDAIAS